MQNWFGCKVSFDKTMENGMQKRVTELYLVDALSFTEAEARIIEEMKPYISGEFTVADVGRKKYSETFFNENGDRFWDAKLNFVTLDEKTKSEKKTPVKMLVQASDIDEALSVLKTGMAGTLADWVIVGITENKIMDVFPYSDVEKKTEN